MPETILRGMTWGHRRAIDPLRDAASRFTAEHPELAVEWHVRSLSAFEHQPFAEAIDGFDLIVFDHPHTGQIARERLLEPLDHFVADGDGALSPQNYIGPSLASYQYDGVVWGAPIDGATINAVYRDDLLRSVSDDVPTSWEDVIRLGEKTTSGGPRVLIAAHGHHALLTVFSLAANLGSQWRENEPIDRDVLAEAIDLFFRALYVSDWKASLASQAIHVHDLLHETDDYSYSPAAYGYATYGEGARGLAFGPFPGPNGAGGTILGGAGVGISAASAKKVEAARFVRDLTLAESQLRFVEHSGQPARVEAWDDESADRRMNGFFSQTRSTMEDSVIRPRFAGYVETETRLAHLLHRGLGGAISRRALVEELTAEMANRLVKKD